MKTKWHFSAHPAGLVCLLTAFFFIPVDRLFAALAAVLIHESAHLIAIWLCKVKHCTVEWTPLGFVAQADGFLFLAPGKRMMIAGAGLAVSGGMTWLSYTWMTGDTFGYLFFLANMALLLINALPVLPLDGGRVLLALAGILGWENSARKILVWLSYLMAVLLSVLGICSAFFGALNPTLLVLGPYLAYAAKQYTIDDGVGWARRLEKQRQSQTGVYRVEPWVAIGEPEPFALIRMLKRTAPEKYIMLQQVNPSDGSCTGNLTQEQIIVKLMGER